MKQHRRRPKQRGASLVEYVLILAAVLCVVGVAYKLLGKKVGHQAANESNTTFHSETGEPTASSEGTSSLGKGGIAMKVSVENGAPSKTQVFVADAKAKIGEKIQEAKETEFDFSIKKMARWLAIVIAALGLGVGYSVFKRGRAEATTADNDPDATGPNPVMRPSTTRAPSVAPSATPTKYTD